MTTCVLGHLTKLEKSYVKEMRRLWRCPVEAYSNWTRMALRVRFFRGMTCRSSIRVLGLNRSLWSVRFLCGSCPGHRGRMGR